MKLKVLAILSLVLGFIGNVAAQPPPPPPPDPEDPFSLFGLPLDDNGIYLALAIMIYGTYTLLKNYGISSSLKKVFIK